MYCWLVMTNGVGVVQGEVSNDNGQDWVIGDKFTAEVGDINNILVYWWETRYSVVRWLLGIEMIIVMEMAVFLMVIIWKVKKERVKSW